jgi:phospholipid/cholesterol/gamma-HCH transport system substrate-binding protein
LALLFFGLNFLHGINIFKPTNYFYATYDSIDGLEETAPVYIKGFKVGQVREIKYDFTKTPSFVLTLDINKDLRLPSGTRVELFDNGLLGGKAVRLVFSPLSERFQSAGDTLSSIAVPGLMTKVKNQFLPKIDSLLTVTDSVILALDRVMDGKQLKNSLNSIEKSSKNLEETTNGLKTAMGDDVPKIIKNVHTITNDFSVVSNNIKQVDFAKTFRGIDTTIVGLQMVTKKINSKDGSLGLLINDRSLYDNLTNTSSSANQLMVDIKDNPKRYVHFSVFAPKSDKKKK